MWIAYFYNGAVAHEWADNYEQAIRLAKRCIVNGYGNPFLVAVTLLGKGGKTQGIRAAKRHLCSGAHPSEEWFKAPAFELSTDRVSWRAV